MLLFPQDTVNGRSTCCLLSTGSVRPFPLGTSHSPSFVRASICEQTFLLAISNFVWLHLNGIFNGILFLSPIIVIPYPYPYPMAPFHPAHLILESPALFTHASLAGWMAGSIPIKKRAVFVDSVVCNSINVSHKMRWPCSFRRYFHCELMSTTKYALLLSCWIEENFMSNLIIFIPGYSFFYTLRLLLLLLLLFNEFVEKVYNIMVVGRGRPSVPFCFIVARFDGTESGRCHERYKFHSSSSLVYVYERSLL